jgi:hypothetical protein
MNACFAGKATYYKDAASAGFARNHGPETNQSHIKKRFAAHVQNMGGEPYA